MAMRVEPVVVVDPDDAAVIRDATRGPGRCRGADGAGEAEGRVVGEGDASSSVSKRVTEVKGPKTSSWKMRISGVTSAKTVGSTKKPPLSARLLGDLAARHEPRTFVQAVAHVTQHALPLLLGDHRPELGGGVGRIADAD